MTSTQQLPTFDYRSFFKNDANKIKIYEFIEKTFNIYDFERLMNFNGDKYDFYEDSDYNFNQNIKALKSLFLVHNAKSISTLSGEKLQFVAKLCDYLPQIKTTDAEHFGEYPAETIYFNQKGSLVVIMHPR